MKLEVLFSRFDRFSYCGLDKNIRHQHVGRFRVAHMVPVLHRESMPVLSSSNDHGVVWEAYTLFP